MPQGQWATHRPLRRRWCRVRTSRPGRPRTLYHCTHTGSRRCVARCAVGGHPWVVAGGRARQHTAKMATTVVQVQGVAAAHPGSAMRLAALRTSGAGRVSGCPASAAEGRLACCNARACVCCGPRRACGSVWLRAASCVARGVAWRALHIHFAHRAMPCLVPLFWCGPPVAVLLSPCRPQPQQRKRWQLLPPPQAAGGQGRQGTRWAQAQWRHHLQSVR